MPPRRRRHSARRARRGRICIGHRRRCGAANKEEEPRREVGRAEGAGHRSPPTLNAEEPGVADAPPRPGQPLSLTLWSPGTGHLDLWEPSPRAASSPSLPAGSCRGSLDAAQHLVPPRGLGLWGLSLHPCGVMDLASPWHSAGMSFAT